MDVKKRRGIYLLLQIYSNSLFFTLATFFAPLARFFHDVAMLRDSVDVVHVASPMIMADFNNLPRINCSIRFLIAGALKALAFFTGTLLNLSAHYTTIQLPSRDISYLNYLFADSPVKYFFEFFIFFIPSHAAYRRAFIF